MSALSAVGSFTFITMHSLSYRHLVFFFGLIYFAVSGNTSVILSEYENLARRASRASGTVYVFIHENSGSGRRHCQDSTWNIHGLIVLSKKELDESQRSIQ